jgi:hypothetical protein
MQKPARRKGADPVKNLNAAKSKNRGEGTAGEALREGGEECRPRSPAYYFN